MTEHSWDEAFDEEILKPVEKRIAKSGVTLANNVLKRTRKFSGQLRASTNLALMKLI